MALTMASGMLVSTGLSGPRATLKRGSKTIDPTRRSSSSRVAAPNTSRCRFSVVARGKSSSSSWSGSDFTVPEKFVSLDDDEAAETAGNEKAASSSGVGGAVQYSLRFYTGSKMGNGLSAPDAGVQVMLIGEDGRAFTQRVDRYPDVGGMADLALYSKPRFERGNIDEVTFDAPDLGLPAALWVAPESGGEWFLEEVELSCSEAPLTTTVRR